MRAVLLLGCGVLLIGGHISGLASALPSVFAAFGRSYVYQGFKVTVAEGQGESPASGTYAISVTTPQGQSTSVKGTRNGAMVDAWVTDLDRNGRFEVAVVTRSAGREGRGVLALWGWTGSELVARPVADLSPAQKQGYRGRDVIRLQGRNIVRVFPIYRPDDMFVNPTGGLRRFHFDFAGSRWVAGPPQRIAAGQFVQAQTNLTSARTVVLHDDGRAEMLLETLTPHLNVATFKGTWTVTGNSVRLTLTERDGQTIHQTLRLQIGERGNVMYTTVDGRRLTLRRHL
jgi:hypothetical protein